jgi:hypothetical protein
MTKADVALSCTLLSDIVTPGSEPVLTAGVVPTGGAPMPGPEVYTMAISTIDPLANFTLYISNVGTVSAGADPSIPVVIANLISRWNAVPALFSLFRATLSGDNPNALLLTSTDWEDMGVNLSYSGEGTSAMLSITRHAAQYPSGVVHFQRWDKSSAQWQSVRNILLSNGYASTDPGDVDTDVDGPFNFRITYDGDDNYNAAGPTDGAACPLSVAAAGYAPNARDLREGVVVGGVTGTLAVPNPGNVYKDIPTDDTVGTLWPRKGSPADSWPHRIVPLDP